MYFRANRTGLGPSSIAISAPWLHESCPSHNDGPSVGGRAPRLRSKSSPGATCEWELFGQSGRWQSGAEADVELDLAPVSCGSPAHTVSRGGQAAFRALRTLGIAFRWSQSGHLLPVSWSEDQSSERPECSETELNQAGRSAMHHLGKPLFGSVRSNDHRRVNAPSVSHRKCEPLQG